MVVKRARNWRRKKQAWRVQEAGNLRDEPRSPLSGRPAAVAATPFNNMIVSSFRERIHRRQHRCRRRWTMSKATRLIQLGAHVTEGLCGRSLARDWPCRREESVDEIMIILAGTHYVFRHRRMAAAPETGRCPDHCQAARKAGILTVGVVTKPFTFEGRRRMQMAEEGIERCARPPTR